MFTGKRIDLSITLCEFSAEWFSPCSTAEDRSGRSALQHQRRTSWCRGDLCQHTSGNILWKSVLINSNVSVITVTMSKKCFDCTWFLKIIFFIIPICVYFMPHRVLKKIPLLFFDQFTVKKSWLSYTRFYEIHAYALCKF